MAMHVMKTATGEWGVFDGNQPKANAEATCGCGSLGEKKAHRIAAALNREPRGAEFVGFTRVSGEDVQVNPVRVDTVESTKDGTLIRTSGWLHEVLGTLPEVLAKLRGTPGEV